MPALVELVAQARAAGVVITRESDTRLSLRAPREAAGLARQLRARDTEVLRLFDWHRASLGDSAPCLLCGQPAILRDPAEHKPAHKLCVDALLRRASAADS